MLLSSRQAHMTELISSSVPMPMRAVILALRRMRMLQGSYTAVISWSTGSSSSSCHWLHRRRPMLESVDHGSAIVSENLTPSQSPFGKVLK